MQSTNSLANLNDSRRSNYGSLASESVESELNTYEVTGEVTTIASDSTRSGQPNIWLIEFALFSNVFLSGFDGTVTASAYQTIGNEFNRVDIASWITTSYLVASTSFQPLYGSFSDVLGRRRCLFFAGTLFGIGCLACAFSTNIYCLNAMRALTGIGGGGLITLSTIVNSDMVPQSKRGLFQAFQNIFLGLGAVLGASVGGLISSSIGWRWCFLLQVPLCVLSLLISHFHVKDQDEYILRVKNGDVEGGFLRLFREIDIPGSVLIVLGLTAQLLYLSLGSSVRTSLSWTHPLLVTLLAASFFFLYLFVIVERTTEAKAIVPKEMTRGLFSFIILTVSFMVGFASYAYLFTLPLFFQIVLGDSAAKAGLRLTIPSFFTPVGGIIMGVLMTKYECLQLLLHFGIILMFFGNALFLFIKKSTPEWLVGLYLVPANMGQGITFPSTLFTFIFGFYKENQASATSTLYLFRSIGSVWGVAGSAGLIQDLVAKNLLRSLKNILDEKELKELIIKINLNTSIVNSLHGEVKHAVIESFDAATKKAHLLSTTLCFLAFLLCIVRDVLQPKTFKQKAELASR